MTIETIVGVGVGVRAAPTDFVAVAGQSLTLRNQDINSKAYLISVYHGFNTASLFTIHSPRLHDNVFCLGFDAPIFIEGAVDLDRVLQSVIPQDIITITGGIGGFAVIGDIVALTIYYESLVGMAANLFDWPSVRSRIKNIITVPFISFPVATGQWSPNVAINAIINLFKANTDYAILGSLNSFGSGIIAINGPCTGNVRQGMPQLLDSNIIGPRYFADISDSLDLATIPVMNSADRDATFVCTCSHLADLTSGNLVLAELKG